MSQPQQQTEVTPDLETRIATLEAEVQALKLALVRLQQRPTETQRLRQLQQHFG